MKRITRSQLQAFNTAFNNYRQLFNLEMDEWQERQLHVLKQTDFSSSVYFKKEHAFTDFGIQSFLHNIKRCHDECLQMLVNVEMARDIADGLYEDDDLEIV